MSELKIGQIKEQLAQTPEASLEEFIAEFEADERAGVVKLVESARKKLEKLEQEKARIEVLKKYEKEYSDHGFICGIDEVGRGP